MTVFRYLLYNIQFSHCKQLKNESSSFKELVLFISANIFDHVLHLVVFFENCKQFRQQTSTTID